MPGHTDNLGGASPETRMPIDCNYGIARQKDIAAVKNGAETLE